MFNKNTFNFYYYLLFVISLVSTFGSLFFSEVMKLPPCELCWYQRIGMYPIPILLSIGILLQDSKAIYYTLPLQLAGFVIAIYHNLLYYGYIENIVPCSQGVSCTSRQIEWFGFITIPFLSLVAFLIGLVISILFLKSSKEQNHAK